MNFIRRLGVSLGWAAVSGAVTFYTGCKSPAEHRHIADQTVQEIISQKYQEGIGREGSIDIERPSTILRRRLLEEQDLVISGPASLGSDRLEVIPHWPDEEYVSVKDDPEAAFERIITDEALQLSLVEALQIGAQNSFDYQQQKEDVFRSALSLDVERNTFRNIFQGQVKSNISADTTGDDTVSGTVQSGTLDVTRNLYEGGQVTAGLAVDLANLLTGGGASSLGLAADTSISVPLMAGSGRHIVTENLTQAERNVIYALWDFEQFKKEFAVNVADSYLRVLRSLDEVKNQRENYRSVTASARRSRRLADAGRLQEIEVDQAAQSELRARQQWISSMENYQGALDSFKMLIGLPPDAKIVLDPNELTKIVAPVEQIRERFVAEEAAQQDQPALPADAPIELKEPSQEDAGPWELDVDMAARVALDNRLDFRKAVEQVYDAQRKVVVAADWLGMELTLGGSASFGSRRSSVGSAQSDDAQLRFDEGLFAGLLTMDLPLERTAERAAYRNSLISLESSVRTVQRQEDQIKLALRNTIRSMRQTRENLYIQIKSVMIAEKRVRSVNLFLEAGRAQMRDLLEAQDALLAAQNSLTAAAVSYRLAELELQRDLGILNIDERGLWQEADPESLAYAKK